MGRPKKPEVLADLHVKVPTHIKKWLVKRARETKASLGFATRSVIEAVYAVEVTAPPETPEQER